MEKLREGIIELTNMGLSIGTLVRLCKDIYRDVHNSQTATGHFDKKEV